jgi:poly-beta-1,6-N-acetyl-D-glucosamine biosynthesis protein PgaD
MNIIDGLQKKSIKILEIVITILGWIFMLGYIIQTLFSIVVLKFKVPAFLTNIFPYGDSKNTIKTVLITIGIAMFAAMIISLWGSYNYRKYAHLKRRTFPKDVTSSKIDGHFGLHPFEVLEMQNSKITVLEKTIV